MLPWAAAAAVAVFAGFMVKRESDVRAMLVAERSEFGFLKAETNALAAALLGAEIPEGSIVARLGTQVGGDSAALAVWHQNSQKVDLRVFGLPHWIPA